MSCFAGATDLFRAIRSVAGRNAFFVRSAVSGKWDTVRLSIDPMIPRISQAALLMQTVCSPRRFPLRVPQRFLRRVGQTSATSNVRSHGHLGSGEHKAMHAQQQGRYLPVSMVQRQGLCGTPWRALGPERSLVSDSLELATLPPGRRRDVALRMAAGTRGQAILHEKIQASVHCQIRTNVRCEVRRLIASTPVLDSASPRR